MNLHTDLTCRNAHLNEKGFTWPERATVVASKKVRDSESLFRKGNLRGKTRRVRSRTGVKKWTLNGFFVTESKSRVNGIIRRKQEINTWVNLFRSRVFLVFVLSKQFLFLQSNKPPTSLMWNYVSCTNVASLYDFTSISPPPRKRRKANPKVRG